MTDPTTPPTGPDAHRLLVVAHDGTWWARQLGAQRSLTFGRGAEADIQLDERSVSRVHARLEIVGEDRYTLTDLGSTNGVAVGRDVIRGTTIEVAPGQPIVFGHTVVVIQAPVAAPAAGGGRPVGGASAMAAVDAQVAKVAPTLLSVLLQGETGVGKDVVTERIHRASTRAAGPLLRLNCAGLSPSLLESELFGHEQGAFTGATRAKQGLLEVAAGGTVLLDEIGEMPLEVQAKLLLVLEQRVVRRVGATRAIPIDVRFLYATHRDLQAEIRAQRFRADFYYRISGVTIRIPALRERRDDIAGLAEQLAGESSARCQHDRAVRFTADALDALRACDWPGNVRELRNVIDRAVIFCRGGVITRGDLIAAELPSPEAEAIAAESTAAGGPPGTPGRGHPGGAIGGALAPAAPAQDPPCATGDADPDERARVIAALGACGGNQSRAARLLGMSRNTLIARIREFGLARPHAR